MEAYPAHPNLLILPAPSPWLPRLLFRSSSRPCLPRHRVGGVPSPLGSWIPGVVPRLWGPGLPAAGRRAFAHVRWARFELLCSAPLNAYGCFLTLKDKWFIILMPLRCLLICSSEMSTDYHRQRYLCVIKEYVSDAAFCQATLQLQFRQLNEWQSSVSSVIQKSRASLQQIQRLPGVFDGCRSRSIQRLPSKGLWKKRLMPAWASTSSIHYKFQESSIYPRGHVKFHLSIYAKLHWDRFKICKDLMFGWLDRFLESKCNRCLIGCTVYIVSNWDKKNTYWDYIYFYLNLL